MPVPDLSGVPPWAEFNDLKNKINDIVAKYNNLLVNLDSLNVVSLTADHIDAGTIDANVVTIRSDLTAGAFVEINGEGMRINNGVYDTFTANTEGKVTMTGALIRSQTGYPMVIMDPDSELLGAYYSETSFISIYNPSGEISPVVRFSYGGADSFIFHDTVGNYVTMTSNDVGINLSTQDEIQLFAPSVYVNNWGFFKNYSSGRSLQQELNSKATVGSSTSSSGSANGGIPIGATWQTSVGTVTWTGVPAHSHTQN